MNVLNGLFGSGNVKADVGVNITFDPASAVLLALLIVFAIVLSHVVLKALR